MNDISPDILRALAAVAFGGSFAMIAVVVYRLLRSESLGRHAYADASQRRGDMRKSAMAKSPLYAIFLTVLRLPAGVVARMDLDVLRNYVHGPYAKAGYPGGLDDDEVVTVGLLISLLIGIFTGISLAVFLGITSSWMGFFAMPAGFLLLISTLQTRGEVRQRRILSAMPYVLDLLVLVLRSGTSLNIALSRVVSDYADHPVGEELGQVLSEIEMGAPRGQAMQRFAQRMANPDITALTESFVQSEELGWPLADTLDRQSDRMATERILRAQSKAGAAGVIVMLPSTLVLMAAILLLFGPMIVRFFQGGLMLK